MEWVAIWLVPVLISTIIEIGIFHIFPVVGVVLLVFWGLCTLGLRTEIFEDGYNKWVEGDGKGEHPWYAWTYTKSNYNWAMENYDDETYIKIDLNTFKKYLYVNPDRYTLYYGYVIFDDENEETVIRMVFPRRQLFAYYKFRRAYIQSVNMQGALKFVQKDIDKTLNDAQTYIERAQKEYKSQFEQMRKKGDDTDISLKL